MWVGVIATLRCLPYYSDGLLPVIRILLSMQAQANRR